MTIQIPDLFIIEGGKYFYAEDGPYGFVDGISPYVGNAGIKFSYGRWSSTACYRGHVDTFVIDEDGMRLTAIGINGPAPEDKELVELDGQLSGPHGYPHGYTNLNIPIKANGIVRFKKRRDSPEHAVDMITIEFEDGKIKNATPSLKNLRMRKALEV